jgi:hypothetical protein
VVRLSSRPYRVCPVCGGSLQDSLDDPGWVKCFACSRSFDAQAIAGESTVETPPLTPPDALSRTLADAKREIEAARGPKRYGPQHPNVRRVID